MQTISQIVSAIIQEDVVALTYLQEGLLNTSAYAEKILPIVEEKVFKDVGKNSIITALSRIKAKASDTHSKLDFKINDIRLILPIAELVYKKNKSLNAEISKVYRSFQNDHKIYLNINNVDHEIDIFASSPAVQKIKEVCGELELVTQENDLAAITLEYSSQYRNYSGMAAQILNALAVANINMVECLTTYSEFTIYIDQQEAQKTIGLLHDKFMYT